jgi:hypothetical protein
MGSINWVFRGVSSGVLAFALSACEIDAESVSSEANDCPQPTAESSEVRAAWEAGDSACVIGSPDATGMRELCVPPLSIPNVTTCSFVVPERKLTRANGSVQVTEIDESAVVALNCQTLILPASASATGDNAASGTWTYDTETRTMTLSGAACEQVKTGSVQVTILFGCPAIAFC